MIPFGLLHVSLQAHLPSQPTAGRGENLDVDEEPHYTCLSGIIIYKRCLKAHRNSRALLQSAVLPYARARSQIAQVLSIDASNRQEVQ
jgi:hypothetical protein